MLPRHPFNRRYVDISNSQLVAVIGDDIVIHVPRRRMSKAEAIVHAAWIIAMADESEGHTEFKRILDEVEAT